MVPLGLVGMSYCEAPSAVRAALAAFDAGADGPSRQLLESGEITGVVRIESCARVEWLFAAARPAWAAELFSATLIDAAENPDRLRPRSRHGAAAAGGLLRVAAGLDSVAQGEHAIGNQVLRSFERAHEAGTMCRNLHVVWRGVGEMLGKARRILPQGRTGGVQQLVIDRIAEVPRERQVPAARLPDRRAGSLSMDLHGPGRCAVRRRPADPRREPRRERDDAGRQLRGRSQG